MGLGDGLAQPVVSGLHRLVCLGHHALGVLGGHDSFGHEPLGELCPDGRVMRNRLRHQRLRVRRLVLLVVAEAAVADEVDDDVVAEALPEGKCETHGRDGGLRVVGVHVDDRRIEPLGEVARVAGGAAFVGVGREADLVVGDQMQRAAGRVAGKPLEVERFRDDALPRKRGVTVDQDRKRD